MDKEEDKFMVNVQVTEVDLQIKDKKKGASIMSSAFKTNPVICLSWRKVEPEELARMIK